MRFTQEEKDILSAYETGKMKLFTPSEKEIDVIKTVARNTIVEGNLISKMS